MSQKKPQLITNITIVESLAANTQDKPHHVTESEKLVAQEGGRGGYNGPVVLPIGSVPSEATAADQTAQDTEEQSNQADSPSTRLLKEVTDTTSASMALACAQLLQQSTDHNDDANTKS